MILKALSLENIRSYKDETTVQIPTGTTLFEGDIASGKSTLLYAIEFALFGLGSLKGAFLLRNGAKRGRVTLLFDVDGKEYEVHRSLVRKEKSVQQGECYIKGPEGKALLSPTELKERILQILRFNEPPNPKAQSVIYRYAIFTPQEEMKEVILKEADQRLQTLRRAFRIEDYKIAAENSSVVVSRVKERIAHLQGATEDLDEVKAKLQEVKENTRKLAEALKPLKQREVELKSQHQKKKEDLKKLEKARERIRQAEERIPLLSSQMADKTKLRDKGVQENTKLRKKIKEEIEPRISELEATKKPTEKTREQLKQALTQSTAKSKEAEKLKAKLEERIGNFESILEKKVCPVCERSVDSKEFKDKTRHLEEEEEKIEEEVQRLSREIEATENLIEELDGYKAAQKELDTLNSQLKESKTKINENEENVEQLEKEIRSLADQLKSAEEEAKPLERVLKQIEDIEKEVADLETKLSDVGKNVAATEKGIEDLEQEKRRLEEQTALKEKQLKIKDSLNEHRIWLNDYFVPTVENIEKHVMTSINQRFNQQFQKWFQILIEDPELQVRVNEDFTPVIERDGYDQDFLTLSGGEKTSVALAYRLALNTAVQEVAVAAEANLLILDEPTDGFSKEQLSKVRDVLDELKCPQVVIVSHEKELESFADQIFSVTKSQGVSTITPQGR